MLIQAYQVDSQRPGLPDGIPLEPIPIGIVQFIGGNDEGIPESQRKKRAIELLMDHSPLAHDPILGYLTWHVEKTSVDDDSLGTALSKNGAEGYRIWLPT